MNVQWSSQDKELLDAIGEILHYVWDPIGVAGIPAARDEYDSYSGHVFTMLMSDATETEIASHLLEMASSRMGLPERDKEAKKAASALVAWHTHIRSGRA